MNDELRLFFVGNNSKTFRLSWWYKTPAETSLSRYLTAFKHLEHRQAGPQKKTFWLIWNSCILYAFSWQQFSSNWTTLPTMNFYSCECFHTNVFLWTWQIILRVPPRKEGLGNHVLYCIFCHLPSHYDFTDSYPLICSYTHHIPLNTH
jgi:hypothetical protein